MGEGGVKSAYELALERLEQQGIERPREDGLEEELRARVADVRSKAQAKLAELEILYGEKQQSLSAADERQRAEQEYQSERRRIEDKRDRDIEKLRSRLLTFREITPARTDVHRHADQRALGQVAAGRAHLQDPQSSDPSLHLGRVRLNGNKAKPHRQVKVDDRIEVDRETGRRCSRSRSCATDRCPRR